MKKLLLISLFALCLIPLQAQFIRANSFYVPIAVAGGGGGDGILSNGDFSSGSTDWTLGTQLSIASGTVAYANDPADTPSTLLQVDADMQTGMQVSTSYNLTFDITNSTALWFKVQNDGAVEYIAGAYYVTGSYDLDFTTPADIGDGGFSIYFWGESIGNIDNIVLTEN